MKKKLSVIIVSYNVKYYLDQCLRSVEKAAYNLPIEIWVVDNNSTDETVKHVKENFPLVNLIANKDNKGFSKANNQAVLKSNAEYILLLNPDTVVGEDTFKKCIGFFDITPDCGGLTVKMIDGFGNFLPESKRGLPTPKVAFNKIFGLSTLFPKSKNFGKYHLGYLSEHEVSEIDVLSGAFMMMRYETLEKSGLLDENFFMYGEDIDLSYRINLSGYKNYYFPNTYIIHYKGESTKKSSINYVFVFYKAMIIFSEKHFSKKFNPIFSALINIAIYLRAGLAILNRFLVSTRFVILDLFFGTLVYKLYLENIIDFKKILFLLFFLIFVQFLQGNYYSELKRFAQVFTFIVFSSTILVFNNLLFISKYSVFNLFIVGAGYFLLHFALTRLFKNHNFFENNIYKKLLVISNDSSDFEKIFSILNQDEKFIDENVKFLNYNEINNISIIELESYTEIVFSTSNILFESIIKQFELWRNLKFEFKIYHRKYNYITSTNNLHIKNVFIVPRFSIAFHQKLQHLMLNYGLAIISILFSPLLLIFGKKQFVLTAFEVLANKRYYTLSNKNGQALFTPEKMISLENINTENIRNIYYKNYNVKNDFSLIFHQLFDV